MQITLSWQLFVGLAGGIGAVVALFGYYNKGYNFVKHQKEQDEDIKDLRDRQERNEKETKEELALLTRGVLACLKGLKEQGCNGPVTEAITMFEEHLNEKAHS